MVLDEYIFVLISMYMYHNHPLQDKTIRPLEKQEAEIRAETVLVFFTNCEHKINKLLFTKKGKNPQQQKKTKKKTQCFF